jgi:hypothetical protein
VLAEDMTPAEHFFWEVMLHDQTGRTAIELDGNGTVDENGFGVFTFEGARGRGSGDLQRLCRPEVRLRRVRRHHSVVGPTNGI